MRRNPEATLERIEAMREAGLTWADIARELGYASRNAPRDFYRRKKNPEAKGDMSAAYKWMASKDPYKVTPRDLAEAAGVSRTQASSALHVLRSQFRQARRDEQPAAPPVWRDMGKGETQAYARALERVERYVAAGDARSAAINQVAQEVGVRVR